MVTVDAEGASQTADDCDRAQARGEPSGPLHAVPVTVRDAFATAGPQRRRTIDNSRAWRSAETVRREFLQAHLTRKTPPGTPPSGPRGSSRARLP